MAGTNRAFNAAKFRSAIQGAMDMGAAVDVSMRATFYFPTVITYSEDTRVDGAGVPFDLAATRTETTPPPKTVSCGVEYFSSTGESVVFGDVVPARAVITLLDVDYDKVEGCIGVVLGGERYKLVEVEPPGALFDVGIYTLHFRSENSTS